MLKRIITLGLASLILLSFLTLSPAVEESPFCMNGVGTFHMKNDPNIWKNSEDRMQRIEQAGAAMDRSDFWWGYIEPKKGEFDWSFPDKVIEFYHNRDVKIFPIFNYFSAWSGNTAPHTPEERVLFGRYVYTVVSRYKKDVHCWEVWNEPNLGMFWSPQPNSKDYAELLKVAYKAAKAADPTCIIAAPALSGADLTFLRELYQYGIKGNYDILSYHYYRTPAPESDPKVIKEIHTIDQFLHQMNDPKHIYITEFGVQSYKGEGGVTEEEQARLLVRNYLELLSTGIVDKGFWFCLMDWVDDPSSPPWDAHLGITRRNLTPKPSFYAYQTMVNQLAGKKYIGQIKSEFGVYQYLFSDSSTTVMVAWTTDTASKTLSIPGIPETTKIIQLDGKEALPLNRASNDTSKSLNFSISNNPVYIQPIPESFIQKVALVIGDYYQEIPAGIPTSLPVTVTNTGKEKIKGIFQVRGQYSWTVEPKQIAYDIEPGQSLSTAITVTTSDDAKSGAYILRVRDIEGARFTGQGKEVQVIKPMTVSYQIPTSFAPQDKPAIKVQVTNNSPAQLQGDFSLTCTPFITLKKANNHLDSPASKKTNLLYPITKLTPPDTFNGRFTETLTWGGYLASGKSSTLFINNKDVTFFPVHKLKKPAVINGDLSKWSGIKPFMDGTSEIRVKLAADSFQKEGDLSATAWLAWDNQNFYIAANVTDDTSVLAPDKNYWDYDSLQIAISPLNDSLIGDSAGMQAHDYEFEAALTKNGPGFYAGTSPANNREDFGKRVHYTIQAKKDGKGYIYEIAIPRGVIPELTYKKGSCFGLCILANDNDGSGRKGWVESTPGIGWGKDPAEYIKVVLVD